MKRGEIHLALAPTFDGSVPKTRPFLVVQSDVQKKLGELSDDLMLKIDECLKAALGIP